MQNSVRRYFRHDSVNAERALAVTGGTLLILHGIRRKSWAGAGLAALGAAIIRHGLNRHCTHDFHPDREQSRNVSIPYRTGARVDEAVTINRPRDEVYRFWRDFSNMAKYTEHVESVRTADNATRSHWIARIGSSRVEWDAEIINEVENDLIGWRSTEGSDVPNAGSVSFRDAAGGRGTEVSIELQYKPFGSKLASGLAKLTGNAPAAAIRHELLRLKTALESGVVPETAGQPAGAKHSSREPRRDQVGIASQESFPASDSPAYTH